MQQLHGFDELRNDRRVIRNRTKKIDTALISLCFSEPYFRFRLFPLAKIIERMENGKNYAFFVRSNGDKDDLRNPIPCITSEIWNLVTLKNSSHVNCMSASQDFVLKSRCFRFFTFLKKN
jgi:hypothetical protein